MTKKGERIGAICSAKNNKVIFFGYGTYQGDEIPPEDIGFGVPNPKIVLDNGQVIWGCQCWWGTEEQVKKQLEGRTIINITPEEFNKNNNEKISKTRIK